MAELEVLMTKEGYNKLKDRLEYLKSVGRAEVAEEIKTARGFGDLSENAEYDAARKKQGEMEGEIADIEAQLRHAKIIAETRVTCVEIADGKEGEEKTYTIVGTSEIDVKNNKISDESPIGAALIKATKAGQTVSVNLPNGRVKQLKIIKIVK